MRHSKKLLALGTLAAVAAPIAAVVSCGTTPTKIAPKKTHANNGNPSVGNAQQPQTIDPVASQPQTKPLVSQTPAKPLEAVQPSGKPTENVENALDRERHTEDKANEFKQNQDNVGSILEQEKRVIAFVQSDEFRQEVLDISREEKQTNMYIVGHYIDRSLKVIVDEGHSYDIAAMTIGTTLEEMKIIILWRFRSDLRHRNDQLTKIAGWTDAFWTVDWTKTEVVREQLDDWESKKRKMPQDGRFIHKEMLPDLFPTLDFSFIEPIDNVNTAPFETITDTATETYIHTSEITQPILSIAERDKALAELRAIQLPSHTSIVEYLNVHPAKAWPDYDEAKELLTKAQFDAEIKLKKEIKAQREAYIAAYPAEVAKTQIPGPVYDLGRFHAALPRDNAQKVQMYLKAIAALTDGTVSMPSDLFGQASSPLGPYFQAITEIAQYRSFYFDFTIKTADRYYKEAILALHHYDPIKYKLPPRWEYLFKEFDKNQAA